MDLQEFILKNLEIDKQKYGRIFSFVDFGNVNYWYEKDRRDWDDNLLKENQKLTINIEKLAHFLNLNTADLYINAQKIKAHIVQIKETSPLTGRGLDIGSVSDGQGNLSITP